MSSARRLVYVTTLYDLPKSGLIGDTGVYDLYKKAFETSLKRVHKFNPTLFDEYIVLINNEGACSNGEMEYHVVRKLYDLWKEGRSILFSEVDTLCHGSLEEILQFKNFKMFAKGSASDPDEYNSGVMYFPTEMNPCIWDCIMQMHRDWKPHWAYIQKVFDTAYKFQGSVTEDPRFNAFSPDIQNPLITHHFSSRGIHNLLEVFKKYESDDPLPAFREF